LGKPAPNKLAYEYAPGDQLSARRWRNGSLLAAAGIAIFRRRPSREILRQRRGELLEGASGEETKVTNSSSTTKQTNQHHCPGFKLRVS